jgi:signal transduction histidine kinase
MKILPKVLISMIAVASFPLIIYGFWSLRIAQGEFLSKTRDLHRLSAKNLSFQINKYITDIVQNIKNGIINIKFFELSEDEKKDVLNTLIRQIPVVKGIRVYEGENRISEAGKGNFKDEFFERVPQSDKEVFSGIKKDSQEVNVILNMGEGRNIFLILDATPVIEMVKKYRIGKDGGAFIYSSEGTIGLEGFRIDEKSEGGFFEISDKLGSYEKVPSLNWFVGVYQPKKEVYSAGMAITYQLLFWIGISLLVASVIAFSISRGITNPIKKCSEGAMEIAKGNLDKRIDIRSRDEVGMLADSFNYMAQELKKSLKEIEKKNMELRKWNLELEKRVEERTRQLREAQEQLIRTQKMAAVGTLGAGVAHELNNPLVGIIGFTQLLLARKKESDADYKILKKIEAQAQRAAKIISALLSFTEREKGKFVFNPLNINDVLEASISLLEAQIRSAGIEVTKELDRDMVEIYGDFSRLQEVFIQIITNAKNAMPSGGRLIIKTSYRDGKVIISIADTGKGIPKEIIPRIFDPFFTTKDWEGVGLGLTIAQRIIEDHKGKIDVESEVGKGTTFTLTIDLEENKKLKGLMIKEEEIKAHLV